MKLKLLAALTAACAACAAPVEQPEARVAPVDVQVEPRFAPEAIETLEAGMRAFVDEGHVPGIETLLIVDGETVSHVKYGVIARETGVPVGDDTIYRIYSMSKPITSVALMTLWEDGAFSLDDPVTKFIPEFSELKVLGGVDEAGNVILVEPDHSPTMREVMSHTAGFAYGLYGEDPANTAFRENQILASPDLDTFIDKTAEVPLLFQPGTNWFYSASVDVQGAVIERITGVKFSEFLQARLFDPLSMTDTGFFVPDEDLDRYSDVYVLDPETAGLVEVDAPWADFTSGVVRMESGGGGLVSTMADYERFTNMLRNGGELDGARILKPETIELMRTDVLPEGVQLFSDGTSTNSGEPGRGFGLGFGLVVDPEAAGAPLGEGTYYWGGAAGTWFWIDPVYDVVFIGMIQRFNAWEEVDFPGQSGALVYTLLEEEGLLSD